MEDRPDSGPSNSEFFEFLARQLSFSIFSRSGSVLTSFKTTIEFAFVAEGTAEGPEEGLLFEGTAPMSHATWSELVASFAMSAIESRHDDGKLARFYRASEADGALPPLPELSRAPAMEPGPFEYAREEVVSERARYVWVGAGRDGGDVGRFSLWARRIACRGADKGLPAQLLYREKLREFAQRRRRAAV